MVQGLAVILVASLLPWGGGLAEEIGLGDPAIVIHDEGIIHVDASGEGARTSLDVLSAEAQASSEALELQAADQRFQATVGHLTPDQLLAFGGGQAGLTLVNLQIGDGQAQAGGVTTSSRAASQPTTAAPDAVVSAIASQAAPAVALAAIALVQAEPAFWDARQLVRRVSPFLASLYSRISRDDVLDHETRSDIYALLRREPGLSLGEISEALDASRSTIRHHVRKLEDAGMVSHETEGRCRIHFPVGRSEEARSQHLLRNPNRARIAEMLERHAMTLTEMAHVLEVEPSAVHFHLKKMREAGLVERTEEDGVLYRSASA